MSNEEGRWGERKVGICRKRIPSKKNSKCKDPETGRYSDCLTNSIKTHEGDEVREVEGGGRQDI